MLVDTHCHIHDKMFKEAPDSVLERAHEAGVKQVICVGTEQPDSRRAIDFAAQFPNVFAAIGVHPHEARHGWDDIATIASEAPKRLVAIGEIGLDYFYTHSPRETQIVALEAQLQIAQTHNLPVIFHVREAFSDFWPIFDNFASLRGELHSFTDSWENCEKAIKRGLFIGVNGISTFTKDASQQEMFARIPLEKMLLETDAPFLTPKPHRGKVNEPAFVRHVAEHHARVRGVTFEEVAQKTSTNADALFALT